MTTAFPKGVAAFPAHQKQMADFAMTVDIEEAFHASALASAAPRSSWRGMESRVVSNTDRILAMFAAVGIVGTFFILGSVAKQHPALVRRIAEAGHEVASHGWAHFRVSEQSPMVFLDDILRTKAELQHCTGKPVFGYRAASFSMNASTWWAYDAMAEVGYRYSSSVNPVKHDHYGMPDAPRAPFRTSSGIIELPMTTLQRIGRRLPVSGGGWFRLLPYSLSRRGLEAARNDGLRPVFYFHPWEIDPNQPRLAVAGRARFRHYVNLAAMEQKVTTLLNDFRWGRVDQVFGDTLTSKVDLWQPEHADNLINNR